MPTGYINMTQPFQAATHEVAPNSVAPDVGRREKVASNPKGGGGQRGEQSLAASLPWYRREAWLVASILAVIPVLLAIIAPQQWRMPLMGLGGLFMAISVMLLFRREQIVRVEKSMQSNPSSRD